MTDARIDVRKTDGGGHGRSVRLMLVVGLSLGILGPTLHNFTLTGVGADLGMGNDARGLAQVLVVCASLAGLFLAGRAVDVYGTRRVVVGSLLGSCVGGAVVVSAPNVWSYGTGLVVESASIMGAVAGYVASVPVLHLTGRLSQAVGAAFAALAVALTTGVLLALVAERVGGWRAVEAVPLAVSVCLLLTAVRLLPVTTPPAGSSVAPPAFGVGCVVTVLLGGTLQAIPLRDWLDVTVVALLVVALSVLTVSCLPVLPFRRGRTDRREADDRGAWKPRSVVGAAVMAGGVWGFGQSATATVLLVLLTEPSGTPEESMVAWMGFGAGFVAAGLYAMRRAVAARTASSLGLTLAAVCTALLPVLPYDRGSTATVLAVLLAAGIGFGVILAQVPWTTRLLVALPARGRGAVGTAYPAAVVLGGAAVSGIPYGSVIPLETRAVTLHGLLWITVAVLALAAVVLGRSGVAIAVAGAALAQYLLVTAVSDDRYAQRPLSMTAFVVTGVIVGLAVWARSRQTERLARTRAGATALQQAVLRPLPARAGDVTLSGLYRPATADVGVGGDFYDVAHTPFGTRVLIGDVRGKGLQAVETVADVLGCFRTQAHETASLTELVARLDRHLSRAAVTRQDGELFATALLLEHSDGTDRLNAVNCGHPFPVMIGPGRHRVREVEVPALLPLGCGLLAPEALPAPTPVELPRGTTLLLYTDGLSEARDASGTFYPLTERLRDLPAGDPGALVAHLADDLTRWTHRLSDDVTLVVLTRSRG
ncbi:MFS transporter [Streptomyces sp. NPDC012693]|uniref:MFS transporter n=1 Tax=Streptomyces sp. NPDC012693 TaxID=3364844 RepID=UPI003697932B